MYAFSPPQEIHTCASPLVTLTCILSGSSISFFFSWWEKRKLVFWRSFQEFAFQAVWPGFTAARQSCLGLFSLSATSWELLLPVWHGAACKASPNSRGDCVLLITRAVKILFLSQNKQVLFPGSDKVLPSGHQVFTGRWEYTRHPFHSP